MEARAAVIVRGDVGDGHQIEDPGELHVVPDRRQVADQSGERLFRARRVAAYADVGQFPPIRLDSSEGKREILLALDVHDRVTQREEGGRPVVPLARIARSSRPRT